LELGASYRRLSIGMSAHPYGSHRLDLFLRILFVLALVGLVVDLFDGELAKIASTLFLSLGLGATLQWRRYRSRRWRTVAWVSFVLATAALLARLNMWYMGD
jgi:hypothetical protein